MNILHMMITHIADGSINVWYQVTSLAVSKNICALWREGWHEWDNQKRGGASWKEWFWNRLVYINCSMYVMVLNSCLRQQLHDVNYFLKGHIHVEIGTAIYDASIGTSTQTSVYLVVAIALYRYHRWYLHLYHCCDTIQ